MTADQLMEAILRDLRSDIVATTQAINSSSYFIADKQVALEGVRQAYLLELWLDGDGRREVNEGRRSFADWKTYAEQVWTQLARLRGFNNRWKWQNAVPELAENVVEAAKSVGFGIGTVAAMVIAAALLLKVR